MSVYKVERRKRPAGLWETVGTGPLSEITLVEQSRNTEWEYRACAPKRLRRRIIAFNPPEADRRFRTEQYGSGGVVKRSIE